MLRNRIILVAGGDLRQAHLIKLLSEYNDVYSVGIEKSDIAVKFSKPLNELQEKPDYIIFPMPISVDGKNINAPFSSKNISVEDILAYADIHTFILGGKITSELCAILQNRKLSYCDFLDREELAVQNAVPTAEGALQIAMEELPVTIFGVNVLVTGYGRIGKILSKYLADLGANVTVTARKYSDLAWIKACGYNAVHNDKLDEAIKNKDLIINTVPVCLFTKERLSNLDNKTLIIDLASKPGGVDFIAANKLGFKTIRALSLPGKVAPYTAGEIIFNTISNIDSERRFSIE